MGQPRKNPSAPVNKKLYMNEDTLEKIDSFYRVKHDLQSLYRVLLRC